ncbi:MAG: alkaline phosphatase [Ancrocorticia sp.]|uniref:alkaline phosphatase n=1 Tax=Ancrocorticia sp. TaxID=2593684 RepID=UPI003F9323BF
MRTETTEDQATPEEQAAVAGPETCITTEEDGSLRILEPGDCAQFGKAGQGRTDETARNVILIIGDGMGEQELTAGRNHLEGAAGRFAGLDDFVATGKYTHHSVNKDGSFQYRTDSASSASAWATGAKTYDGAIGVDLAGEPLENLLEIAKKDGMRTGNVSTAQVQDATPAAMSSHALDRNCYGPNEESNSETCQGDDFSTQYRENGGLGSISEQIVDLRPDVTLGGGWGPFEEDVVEGGEGRNPYLDNTTTWTAGDTVRENAEANGFQVVNNADELSSITEANQDAPVLGLFNEGHMTRRYEQVAPTSGGSQDSPTECVAADRGGEPELVDMTNKAIELLDDPEAEEGFMLQIESASIDKGAHDADACGTLGEMGQADEAVRAALDFAEEDGETLVIVTSDHSQSTQIVEDDTETVSATTRVTTVDGAHQSIGYSTKPLDEILNDPDVSLQHTGSQLRIAAYGPGAENVIGRSDQTDLHYTIANALELGDWEVAEVNPDLGVDVSQAADPVDAVETCYMVGGDGSVVPGAGDCAQFGTEGQGIDDEEAQNVVIVIADGTGDSEVTSARNYLHGANGRFAGIDELPFTGSATTFSLDAETGLPDYVTDSSASASAWTTGTKTYDGAVAVDREGNPVVTLAELARMDGMKVGNVSTAELQDATPGSFAAHALDRKCYGPEEGKNDESCQGEDFASQYRENGGIGSISEQIVDLRADVTLGGGSAAFDQIVQEGGNWGGNTWTEGESVVANAENQGYQVVTTADELDGISAASSEEPVLGLFAEGNFPRNYAQSIPETDGASQESIECVPNPDRPETIPGLDQMTAKALDMLQNDDGFLLQIEAASVDKANHEADFCGMAGEFEEYDLAVQTVRDWAEETGEPTLLIVTTDHAHASQITGVDENTAGLTSKVVTADGDDMVINWATAASNDHEVALGNQNHTGSQVRVEAEGPGAQNILGQIDQTDIGFVVTNALGLDFVNHDVDLTAQWDQDSQYPVSGSGGSNTVWVVVGAIVVIALLGGLVYVFYARRKQAE